MSLKMRRCTNAEAVPRREIPLVETTEFLQGLLDLLDHGWRLSSYFGIPGSDGLTLMAVLSAERGGEIGLAAAPVAPGPIPSLATLCPQVGLFEREIAEQCGVRFEGHPWMKPVRFQEPLGAGKRNPERRPGVMEFYRVRGDQVHEVAVGPVHAGVIEPGHFRFQCHGEEVFHLEISLGYQHRGIEADLIGGPHPRTRHRMETVAGDTTIGHGQAYAMILEGLGNCRVPPRAEVIRGIALELERLANHTGDLGAVATDVGYLPTASFCGRIRGDFLTMTALLCGSRFGRGLVIPGGTGFDCDGQMAEELLTRLAAARNDLESAVNLLWDTPSVMARFETTGTVTGEAARELGLVGPAARASGLKRDVRHDHPFGIYRTRPVPEATTPTGDVHGRALVRWLEAGHSLEFIVEQLRKLPEGAYRAPLGNPAGDHVVAALTEGWRGEVCHTAVTDREGRFLRYKVVDPSFHNWQGLALALRGEQISDFPLCNKSFNLSYCGFDL